MLDPTLARTYVGRIVFASLCDKLFDIDDKLNIVPQLALSHATSEDGKTVTIKLRQGVKFHDGTAMDAAAVKAAAARKATADAAASAAAATKMAATYRTVQTALNRIGYGPVPVDGTANKATLDAIRGFELDNGLSVSGEPSDALIQRLVAIGAIKLN